MQRIKPPRALIIVVLSFYFLHFAQGQNSEFYQKLTQADKLLNEGQIQEAILVLSNLKNQGIQNEDLSRLLGKAYYWSKDFPKTKEFFKQEISSNPEFLELQLDYARIRYEFQEWEAAEQLLEALYPKLPKHPEINQKLAEINYWTGGSKEKSLEFLERILSEYPNNPSAGQLKEEIISQTAPLLSIQSGYYSDSQPLRYGIIGGKFSGYQSSKLQPFIRIENRFYAENQRISLLELGNKLAFPSSKTTLILTGGLVQNSRFNELDFTYEASLEQGLGKGFFAGAALGKEAYLYTLASLEEVISPKLAQISLERKSENSWMGKFQANQRTFESDNKLQMLSLWVLIPIIKSQSVKFYLGYSGTLADTDSVRFETVSMPSPPIRPSFGELIPGAYSPYFTPINQSILGALAKISLDLGESQNISITGNYGVFAEISNPNIYYFGPETPGNAPINTENMVLLFNTETYNPVELKFEYSNTFSERTSINLSYQYQKTIFFDSHFVAFNLNLKLY
ncbi:tetratricopeptide repeat protein [Algoriphagus hitonicola]|nr:tetratricopeptide repeat protein [Algoriphagus hitonicola]